GLAIDPAHAAPPPPARHGGRAKPGHPAGGCRGGRRAASSQQLRSNISSFEQKCKYFPLAELQLSEMSVPAGIVGGSQAIPEEASVCWLCDHPGATELDYQDHLRQLIDTF